MFTGLIAATGTILSITPPHTATGPTRLTISTPELAPKLNTGDSIAVSGVCLTALDITPNQFTADLAEETVRRTKLTRLTSGDAVNLELPTPAGSPMGGHVVQGHVDGVGAVVDLEAVDAANLATTDWRLRVQVPAELTRYVASQGSITLDGISLTIARLIDDIVTIAVIPHTYAATAVHALTPGTPINIEVDVLAKYAERQAQPSANSAWTVTEDYLLANGY